MLKNCTLPATYKNCKRSIKCGEIIWHDDTDFTIICIYCKIKIFEFDDFIIHYRNVHLNGAAEEAPTATQFTYREYIKEENREELEYPTGTDEECFADLEPVRVLASTNVTAKAVAGPSRPNDGNEKLDISNGSCGNSDNATATAIDVAVEVGFGGIGDESDMDTEWQPNDELTMTGATDYGDGNNDDGNDSDNRILKKRKPKEFVCEQCPKRYTTEKCLKMHIKMQHLRPNNFKCEDCGDAFTERRLLKSHVRNLHTLFPCPQCDRVYRNAHSLRVHASAHKEVKDFVCDFPNCGKAFVDQRRLTVHKGVHSEERNFICEICGYRTRLKDALVIHKRSHTGEKPYECKVCGRRFTSASLLNEHKPMHSTERPHVCDVCGASFSRAKALYHHKHLHLGIKKFICKLCGRAYAQMAGLSGHMRQHRMDDSHLDHLPI